jgi:hypothetical protein
MENFDPLGGVFNFVFVGVKGAPESHCNPVWTTNMFPFHTTEYTPLVAEKPFISMNPESGACEQKSPRSFVLRCHFLMNHTVICQGRLGTNTKKT